MKFTINKNIDNKFTFTIKENGSIGPITIAGGDTFVFYLKNPETGAVRIQKKATILDANNGKIQVIITSAEAAGLDREVGDRADDFYYKPVYSGMIVGETSGYGQIVSKIKRIYVD